MLGRLKFEIDTLVDEILDQVPSEVWSSSSTTFLDPAMGGGQFVRAIENRLRNAGHSLANIASRVNGYESNRMRINFAVNKYKLVGTYTNKEFMEDKSNMKFDVIVGNPPFKNGNETGGKSSLWRKIVNKSWNQLNDGGIITMITPQFPNSAADLGNIFTKHQTTTVWTDIAHHFPGVGSSFFAWSVSKTPKTALTNFINDGISIDITNKSLPKDLRSMSIISKVMNNTLFECKSSPEYLHTSVADGKDDDRLYSKKTNQHTFAIRRTSGDNYTMWGSVLPTDYTEPKVVMTFSGNPHYKFHDSLDPIGTIKFQSGHIIVKSKLEGENLINLYKSKLYKFIQDQMVSGGMRGKSFYQMPVMDLNKLWSDEDLFKYFNLNEEEVSLINEYN
jgi:hypothetical protein